MSATMCIARNRDGRPCGNGAGRGTSHPGWGVCAAHGGATPEGDEHADRLRDIIGSASTIEEMRAAIVALPLPPRPKRQNDARESPPDREGQARDGTVTGGQP